MSLKILHDRIVSEGLPRTELEDEGSLDLNLLKELGRSSLVNALNSVCVECFVLCHILSSAAQVNGAKTLVLDPSIAGPLGLLTEVSLLKVRANVSHLITTLINL